MFPRQPGESRPGQVAVFTFNGDDALRGRFEPPLVRTLRKQRLSVTATLRPADSPAQYRAMSCFSDLPCTSMAGISGDGDRRTAVIRLPQRRDRPVFHVGKILGVDAGDHWSDRGRAMEPGRLGHHADVLQRFKTSPARIRADVHRGRLTTGTSQSARSRLLRRASGEQISVNPMVDSISKGVRKMKLLAS